MPTYTLRPNANWAGSSLFTVTGTTYAYTALSDDSDTTYIQKTSSDATAGAIELEFGTTSIPANEKIVKINFRVRISKDGILPHFSDEGFVCDYALDGENPIKQAYQYLKTLPPTFTSCVFSSK